MFYSRFAAFIPFLPDIVRGLPNSGNYYHSGQSHKNGKVWYNKGVRSAGDSKAQLNSGCLQIRRFRYIRIRVFLHFGVLTHPHTNSGRFELFLGGFAYFFYIGRNRHEFDYK